MTYVHRPDLHLPPLPNQRWRLATLFLYATGIRLGEFCRLKREHIRWEQGYLEIERNKQNKPLLIALTPAIEKILRTAQAMDQSEYVFSRDGKPIAYEAAKHYYRWISKKMGYPVSAHRFRHSHGSHRVEAGDNLKNIQDSLGHADIRTTTKFYVDLPLAAQRDGLQRLPIEDLLTIPAITKTVRGR